MFQLPQEIARTSDNRFNIWEIKSQSHFIKIKWINLLNED